MSIMDICFLVLAVIAFGGIGWYTKKNGVEYGG